MKGTPMTETGPADEDFPALCTVRPPADMADEYDEVSPGVWLANCLYGDFAEPVDTVAWTGTDGDRPGGADDAHLDRHGDHFVYTTTWTDGPTYLGRFPTVAAAVAAWVPHVTIPGTTPRIVVFDSDQAG